MNDPYATTICAGCGEAWWNEWPDNDVVVSGFDEAGKERWLCFDCFSLEQVGIPPFPATGGLSNADSSAV